MRTPTPEFRDNTGAQRFELLVDGRLAAQADYRLHGDTLTFTHTEVQADHEGQGLGSRIARAALDQARSRGLAVVASCSFIAGYIGKHPEYADLLKR